jgi:hypothetical protein
LKRLNPDLSVQIMQEYLLHPQNSNAHVNIEIKKTLCVRLLEMVIEACPGLGIALLLLGRVKMLFGDLNGISCFFIIMLLFEK